MKQFYGDSYLSGLPDNPLNSNQVYALKEWKEKNGIDENEKLVIFINVHKVYDHVFVMQQEGSQEGSYEDRLKKYKMLKSIVEILKIVGTFSDDVLLQIAFQGYMYAVESCQNFYKEFEELTAQKTVTESEKKKLLDLSTLLIDLVRMSGNLKKMLKEALDRFHTPRHDFYNQEFKKLAAASQAFIPCLGKILYLKVELLSVLGPEYYKEVDYSVQALAEISPLLHVEEINRKILLRRYLYTLGQYLFVAPLPQDYEKNVVELSSLRDDVAQQVEVVKIFLLLCKSNNSIEFKELQNTLLQANILYRYYGNILIDTFWYNALSKVFEQFLVRLNASEDITLYRQNYDLVMSIIQIIPDEYLKGDVLGQQYITFLFNSFKADDVLAAYDLCSYMSIVNKFIFPVSYINSIYKLLYCDGFTTSHTTESILPVVFDNDYKQKKYPLRNAFLELIKKHALLPSAANFVVAERILYDSVNADSIEGLYKLAQDLVAFSKNKTVYNRYFGNFFDKVSLLPNTYERIIYTQDTAFNPCTY